MKLLADQHIAGVYRTSQNAYKKYLSTRPAASVDSNKRAKKVKFINLQLIDDFIGNNLNNKNNNKKSDDDLDSTEQKFNVKQDLILKMKKYRPSGVSVNFCSFCYLF